MRMRTFSLPFLQDNTFFAGFEVAQPSRLLAFFTCNEDRCVTPKSCKMEACVTLKHCYNSSLRSLCLCARIILFACSCTHACLRASIAQAGNQKNSRTEAQRTQRKEEVKFPPVCVLRTGRRRGDAATALVLQING